MSNTPFNPLPLQPLLQQGFSSIVADSRQVKQGDIFIAYQGEYADGRNYIQQAVDNGAKAVVYQADNIFRLPENISVPWKKAANCKTKEEFEALIREENIELTPEQVEALAGGKSCGCDCVCDYDCVIDACMLFPHGT